jgi:hypothetical protein
MYNGCRREDEQMADELGAPRCARAMDREDAEDARPEMADTTNPQLARRDTRI